MAARSGPRPIALAVIRNRDRLLVFEVADPVRGVIGYRPLGGSIEFGERGHETVAREIREEIGAELIDIRYLATVENIHQYLGKPGHEIVRIYEGRLSDPSFHDRDVIQGREEDGSELRCTWKPVADFERGAPLYPEGLLDLLQSGTGRG
jgi:ADP-ribose pyrophosphatase YjhB (NUDIX family)